MAEILSQAEIDELLGALRSGRALEPTPEELEDGHSVRPYDFRTANRFTKDQMRSLTVVLQTYAQRFANQVSSILRVSCECEFLTVEEMGYNEFNNSIPSPVILSVFSAPPLSGSQVMQVSPEIAYMLINRLLGGITPSKESGKQFTEIELALIERFLSRIMHTFDEAWEKLITVRSKLERLETNTQFVQVAAPNDAVAVGTLTLKIGEDDGLFSICLPRSSIETIAGQLSSRTLYKGYGTERERDESHIQLLEEKISKVSVSMVAHFADTPATVSDIVNLQIGDVIMLAHKTDEPLFMRVAHIPKFIGKLGVSDSRYAIRITEVINEGAENDEFFTGG